MHNIGDLLPEEGIITPEQLRKALNKQRVSTKSSAPSPTRSSPLLRGRKKPPMKTIRPILAVLVTALALCVSQFASAQQPTGPTDYVVQSGDTLWELSGFHKGDPKLWRALVDANPFLQEPGRIYEKGDQIIALIRPGEQLAGLKQLGILPNPLPIESLRPTGTSSGFVTPWWWLILLLVGMAAALFFLKTDFLRRRAVATPRDPARPRPTAAPTAPDPVVTGPPFVAPEVPRTSELVAQQFEQIAIAAAAQLYPHAPTPIRLRRAGDIETGFISGTGRVHYADGTNREMTLTRQRAFRALYELPGGEREFLYSLHVCMNPVTYSGEFLRGFDWEPAVEAERIIVPAPPGPPPAERTVAPAPAVVEVGRAHVPVTVNVSIRADEDGRLAAVIAGVAMTGGAEPASALVADELLV